MLAPVLELVEVDTEEKVDVEVPSLIDELFRNVPLPEIGSLFETAVSDAPEIAGS